MDILTEEENVEVQREKQQRQDAFEQLEQRESEIARIRDGELSAKRKPRPTQATKREAFNKYLKIFFDRPKIEVSLEVGGYDQRKNCVEKYLHIKPNSFVQCKNDCCLTIAAYHIEAGTKWPPFSRRHFQMRCLE